MFSSDPKIVLYLTSDSLQLYKKGIDNSQTLVFPKEVIDKYQLRDKPRLEDLLVDFLLNLPFKKQKLIFVLSGDVVVEQTFSQTAQDFQVQINGFLDKLPFADNQVAHKQINKGSDVQVIAINKNLLECVGDVFEKLGWEIISVVPADMIGISKSSALTPEEMELALKNYKKAQQGDFIYADTGRLDQEVVNNKPGRSTSSIVMTLILLVVLLGLIAGGILFGSKYFSLSFLNFNHQAVQATPQPTVAPTPAPASAPPATTAAKEALNVQVLNGSGVRGQAATIQQQLQDLGYKQIQTSNADTDQDVTSVTFSANVVKSMQDEIVAELKKTFTDVTVKQNQESGNFDVTITTGKNHI